MRTAARARGAFLCVVRAATCDGSLKACHWARGFVLQRPQRSGAQSRTERCATANASKPGKHTDYCTPTVQPCCAAAVSVASAASEDYWSCQTFASKDCAICHCAAVSLARRLARAGSSCQNAVAFLARRQARAVSSCQNAAVLLARRQARAVSSCQNAAVLLARRQARAVSSCQNAAVLLARRQACL